MNIIKIIQHMQKIIYQEKLNNSDSIKLYLKFKKKYEELKNKIDIFLNQLKSKDKKIIGYLATSKGTTPLNFCKIDENIIEYICDTTVEKIGKYYSGTHTPIISTEQFRNDNPDIACLVASNQKNKIFNKKKVFTTSNEMWFSYVQF